jgi:hypothetical protein
LDEPKTRFMTESNLSAPSIFDLSYPAARSGFRFFARPNEQRRRGRWRQQ